MSRAWQACHVTLVSRLSQPVRSQVSPPAAPRGSPATASGPTGEPSSALPAGPAAAACPVFLLPASGFFCQPAAVADVLLTARYLRTAHRIELYVDGEHAATIGGLPPVKIAEYGLDELTFEQCAEDLATSGDPQLVGRRLTFSTQIVFQGHGRPQDTRC